MKLTAQKAELLLAAVITARATSFMFSKLVLEDLSPFNMMSIRFLMAFVLMAALFHKKLIHMTKEELLAGIATGAAFFAVLTAEFYGLKTADSSAASFLENTAIVFVPFFEAALSRRRPDRKAVIAALLAFAGVGLLTLRSGSFSLNRGELLCILAAVLYAGAIIVTNRMSRKGDALTIGIIQVGTTGLLGTAGAFMFESPHLPSSPQVWILLFCLAVVCTGFGFTLQPVAQSRISSEKAGLFCALAPLVSGVMGVLFLHEHLGIQGIAGCALILLAILSSYLADMRKQNT